MEMEAQEQRINVNIIKLMDDLNSSSATTISCGEHTTDEEEDDVDVYHQTQQGRARNNQVFPQIIELNVGGVLETTSLSTLCKFPDSMLAAMFSGRHHLLTDKNGRYFIDRNGSTFLHILNYLRDEQLPSLDDCLKVYREAQFFNIQPLIEELELLRPVAGYKQKKNFLLHVPHYDDHMHVLLMQAQHMANVTPGRLAKLKVCVFKQEDIPSSSDVTTNMRRLSGSGSMLDGSQYQPTTHYGNHVCDVHVSFGPWTATPDVYDLIDCIKHDLSEKGYQLMYECIGICDKLITGQHYCKRPIFEFKFQWW